MSKPKKLNDKEFKQMINLLSRYVESELDQWELWKFKSSFGLIYINISMRRQNPEEAYIDLSNFLDVQ